MTLVQALADPRESGGGGRRVDRQEERGGLIKIPFSAPAHKRGVTPVSTNFAACNITLRIRCWH